MPLSRQEIQSKKNQAEVILQQIRSFQRQLSVPTTTSATEEYCTRQILEHTALLDHLVLKDIQGEMPQELQQYADIVAQRQKAYGGTYHAVERCVASELEDTVSAPKEKWRPQSKPRVLHLYESSFNADGALEEKLVVNTELAKGDPLFEDLPSRIRHVECVVESVNPDPSLDVERTLKANKVSYDKRDYKSLLDRCTAASLSRKNKYLLQKIYDKYTELGVANGQQG